jgi:hypothetical protein
MIKMHKILGSLLLLISAPVLSLSTASVNQSWFYPGDQVVLTISSNGNNIIFPSIQAIEENPVLYTSNAQKISIINNQRSRQSSKSFVIKPHESLTIPAYTVMVDGSEQTTQPIEITLKQPTQTKAGDDHILEIETNKQTMFLGDELELKVTFKERKSPSMGDQVSIIMPEVKGLLFIKKPKSNQTTDEDYNIHTLIYRVSADDFGNFTIPSVVANIAKRNNNVFGGFSSLGQPDRIKKIHSNSLTLKVKPLPEALRIFGNLKIKANIDKANIKQGQALNLTITIYGQGNFEDIEKYHLDIENTTVYSDESEFSYNQWQQKFAIVADQNFTIPSFTLDYFDKNTQRKKSVTTQSIDVQVEGAQAVQKIANKTVKKTVNMAGNLPANNLKYIYLLLGVVIGGLISTLLIWFKHKKPNTDKNLTNQIKLARGDKALFNLLLPLNMAELAEILQQLEANIYKNAQHKIRKKDIINVIKSERKTH